MRKIASKFRLLQLRRSALLMILGQTAVAVAVAPMAHADSRITASQICSEMHPRWIPMKAAFRDEGVCTVSGTLIAGSKILQTDHPINQWMQIRYPGSYQANPQDPLSDWIIPQSTSTINKFPSTNTPTITTDTLPDDNF